MKQGEGENDACHHQVKIKRYEYANRFLGNMVTVRIPVGEGVSRGGRRK